MTPQELVGLALKVSITLTVFGFGLQATRDDLLYVLRRPGLLARSLVAMFVIMPVVAILLTTIFHFQLPVMIALIALSISPVPPVLPRKIGKAGGVAPYGLGLMVTAATLSILFIPLAVHLIGEYFHKPFAMGPGAVAKLILVSVLLPIAAGMVFQRALPALAKRIAKPVGLIAKILLIVGLLAILVFALPKSFALIGNGTPLVVLIAFIVIGLLVGHLLGGPGPEEQITLSLSTACRHPALAIALAAANLPNEHNVFSAILLYLVLSAIITSAYMFWRRRKIKDSPEHAHTQVTV
jgi:bile acid:Na+ symporter, BASS family